MDQEQDITYVTTKSWCPNQEMEINDYTSGPCALQVIPEDGNLCRAGKISCVVISSKDHHVVFDLLNVVEGEIIDWLEDFLEGSSGKIIDDSRMASDALYHLLGISLCEVHDIAAWDLILKDKNAPRKMSDIFRDCIPPEGPGKFRVQDQEVTRGEWMSATTEEFGERRERPVSPKMVEKMKEYSQKLFYVVDYQYEKAEAIQAIKAKIQCIKHLEVRNMKLKKFIADSSSLFTPRNMTILKARYNLLFFRWRKPLPPFPKQTNSSSLSQTRFKKKFLEFLVFYQNEECLARVQELIERGPETKKKKEVRESRGLVQAWFWFCFLSTDLPIWSYFLGLGK